MADFSWRSTFIASTGNDTDGIRYIDVPNDREYWVKSLLVTYERDSDITYTGALAPRIDIVTSTSEHGNATERILARFEGIGTMTADTVASYVFFQPVVPAGDTYEGVAVATQYWYVPIPDDLIVSTSHRIKVYTNPSTGGELSILDVEGLIYVRDNKGHRA